MAVITINRYYASGGRKLGRLLAQRLGYAYVDKYLLQKIAEDLNVSEKTLESFEKSREYRISNLFSKLFNQSYIQRIVGHDKSIVEEQEYQTSLRNLILKIAEEDNVVIIGRAAYYFLKDMKNCYHFHLFAPMDWRKKYAMEELNIPGSIVEECIERHDKNEEWFLRSICGKSFNDPVFFHLKLNESRIPIEKAIDIIKWVANVKDS
jgi:CMP/dCMP kinase